jgi:hypothetical protein
MPGKEVIRAAQMFTTHGQASKVSVVKEIVIALTLGGALGMLWQVLYFSSSFFICIYSSLIIDDTS